MQTDAEFADKVNRYMAQDKDAGEPYHGETVVQHYLELLRDTVGFDQVKAKVQKPLTGKKVACYYGCLLLRPGKVMQMDDPENPHIMEDLIRALGGEPVVWAARNECCGGYVALENEPSARKKSEKVLGDAQSHGADLIVTACPLCRYNLSKYSADVPVVLLHRAAGAGSGRGGGSVMQTKNERLKEQVVRMSGVNPLKCMRCGKCSATCPAYDEMEYHPHQFVYMVETGRDRAPAEFEVPLPVPVLLRLRGALPPRRGARQAGGGRPPGGHPSEGHEPHDGGRHPRPAGRRYAPAGAS